MAQLAHVDSVSTCLYYNLAPAFLSHASSTTARAVASPYRDHLWTLLELGGLLTVSFTLALGEMDEGGDSDAASALFELIITCNVTFTLCVVAVTLLEMRRKQLRSLRAQALWGDSPSQR